MILEKISSEEFEERKKTGEFGSVIEIMQDDEADECMIENKTKSKLNKKSVDDSIVKVTYEIPKKIKQALKRKAANEDKKINEIVTSILLREIEEKYFEIY
ncbi:hypothetical protein [Tepidibacter mesophilus]|uniref:hypothetical protein n=1 Tax=Tepidibacter mesophilus TaxID=655607 RepID=UPI000C08693C|nr:hypothetical protein [Tepidibacter mesophilus]